MNKNYPERLGDSESFYSLNISKKKLTKSFNFHMHDFYEFEWVEDGAFDHYIDGRQKTVNKNGLIFVDPTDIHSLWLKGEPPLLITVHFGPQLLTDTAKKIADSLSVKEFTFNNEETNFIKNSFSYLSEIYDKDISYKKEIIKNRLEAIFLILASKDGEFSKKEQSTVKKAMEYIDANFKEPLTLEETAKKFGYSKSAFSVHFHKNSGKTFQDYLSEKRLAYSAVLLELTGLSVTEAGFCSGFNSHSYFSNAFKKFYGISPTDYRKISHKNKNKS